jgi:hypothetical protein
LTTEERDAAVLTAEDRSEIVTLCLLPHRCYDDGAWDLLDEVFTEVVAMPSLEQALARDFDQDTYLDDHPVPRRDLCRALASFKEGLSTQHLVMGHTVTGDGDQAVCRAHSLNVHLPAGSTTGPFLLHGNGYRFDVVRTPSGWRIRGWIPEVRWSSGDPGVHDAHRKQAAWTESQRNDPASP